jgi:hypothetical protein
MACVVYTDKYKDTALVALQKDLVKRIDVSNGSRRLTTVKLVHMYLVEENVVERPCKIPFSYGVKSTTKHGIKTHRPSRSTLDTFNHVFEGNLRPNQKECRTQIMDLLRAHKSVMMACYTGFGKTVTAINVANKIKLKTLIAVPKKPLLAQWSDEIRQFLPNATVTVIDPNKLAKLTACLLYTSDAADEEL